jgi:hypothetical protein
MPPMPRLLHLDVSGSRGVGVAGFAHLLANAPLLQTLNAGFTALSEPQEWLSSLSSVPQLTHLSLCGCSSLSDAALAHLARVPLLRRLNISHCRLLTSEGLLHLRHVPLLEELDICYSDQIALSALSHLTHVPRLSRFKFGHNPLVPRQDISGMPVMSALQSLGIYVANLTDADLELLSWRLTSLRELILVGCDRITDAGLAYV